MVGSIMSACIIVNHKHNKHWLSDKSLNNLNMCTQILQRLQHNSIRHRVGRRYKTSLRADCEVWLSQKAGKIEGANRQSDYRRLFLLIRWTRLKSVDVSELFWNRMLFSYVTENAVQYGGLETYWNNSAGLLLLILLPLIHASLMNGLLI